jgi:pimeloyl-ACP methyl ester carboxylesterase
VKRRNAIRLMFGCAAGAVARASGLSSTAESPTSAESYHGYNLQKMTVNGLDGLVVQPKESLPGNPWLWRTMFWDVFVEVDLAILQAGFHVAFIDVGNTFGSPDAMKNFDAFYRTMTEQYGLSDKPALEGLSRGGLYAYRWAYVNTERVGCIYADAPVCDLKSWPGGRGKGVGSPPDWQEAIKAYHFTSESELIEFKGNPIDILGPIAAAHIPILHVCGDADTAVPEGENTDIVRERYMAMGGDFALIVKEGCGHHPHSLKDTRPIVNFILAHCARGETAKNAAPLAPKPGSVLKLAPGQW